MNFSKSLRTVFFTEPLRWLFLPWLKRRKNLELLELCLQNCGLGMTSENFQGRLQLIKDDIPQEDANLRELISPRL